MLKRGIQVLILAILVSVNWQLEAKRDACEERGPEWCCENIACPIHEDLCELEGGTTSCDWDGENCDAKPCIRPM
jgi:hypothetical protein